MQYNTAVKQLINSGPHIVFSSIPFNNRHKKVILKVYFGMVSHPQCHRVTEQEPEPSRTKGQPYMYSSPFQDIHMSMHQEMFAQTDSHYIA